MAQSVPLDRNENSMCNNQVCLFSLCLGIAALDRFQLLTSTHLCSLHVFEILKLASCCVQLNVLFFSLTIYKPMLGVLLFYLFFSCYGPVL